MKPDGGGPSRSCPSGHQDSLCRITTWLLPCSSTRAESLIARRESKGLLGGLWEFPKSRVPRLPHSGPTLRGALTAAVPGLRILRLMTSEPLIIVQHAYSHFSVTVRAFACAARSPSRIKYGQWVTIRRLSQFPMGKVDRLIANQLEETS